MTPLLLFVRPPRPVWPFNGPSTAFWPPLAFASLAAMVRQRVPGVRVEILDAPTLEMGWRSLGDELRRRRPAIVAIGEEAVCCVENLRLARLARALGARVVAGGCFFGHVAPHVLRSGAVDAVVHGEGEQTLAEAVPALLEGGAEALGRVAGLSFLRDGAAMRTAPRPLIADLDSLPMPAWELLPMGRYGAASRNHAGLAAIEAGRGCPDRCAFCVLWRQMGSLVADAPQPRLRVKSAARLLEEIRVQARAHGRRHFGWVDPCFNAHPTVPAELAEALLRSGLQITQSAWARADFLVRDERAGALEPQVRAGLNELFVGVERTDDPALARVDKGLRIETAREAFRIVAERYPQVFTLGTFIYGLPDDTPEAMRALFRLSHQLALDHTFFIPLTPLPGTPYWRDELWDASGEAFRDFSFLPSGQAALRRLERALLAAFLTQWTSARVRSYGRSLACGDARKRRMALRLAGRSLGFVVGGMLGGLLTGRRGGLRFPTWYER